MKFWFLGGSKIDQEHWSNYFESADIIVFTTAWDKEFSVAQQKDKLHALMAEDKLLSKPIQVRLHGQDPNAVNKIDLRDMASTFDMNSVRTRSWQCHNGNDSDLTWLVHQAMIKVSIDIE